MTTKIVLKLEISTEVYNDDVMERLRTEIRKEIKGFVFDCSQNVEVLDGPINPQNLLIEGGITVECK